MTNIILIIVFIISLIFKSIFVDKIMVLVIIVLLIYLGSKEEKIINPYYLFALTPISLLLYFNVSDYYMLDLTHETYLLSILNIITFILVFSSTSVSKSKIVKNQKLNNKFNSISFLRYSTFFLLSLSLLSYLVPWLESVIWLFAVPGIVCAFKSKEKKLILIVIGYILFVASIELSKMAVLFYILAIIISLERFYSFFKEKSIRIKITLFLSIILLIYSFSFANKDRGFYDSESGMEYYASQGAEWNSSVVFFLPYMYFTTPWSNLQFVINNQDSRTYGLWTIKPVLGYLGLKNFFNENYKLESYSSFNTFTFITVGFKDFGYWLSFLPTILIAFLSKKVYSKYLVSQSPYDVANYIIFSLAILLMFFSNHFYMLSYPFTMLILMLIFKFKIRQVNR